MNLVQRIIDHVGRKQWWHVPPRDPVAYKKRGKFYASTYQEAEFWGRPLDQPERVQVHRPLVGDEITVELELFGSPITPEKEWEDMEPSKAIQERFRLDAQIKAIAQRKGYDSIVLMSPSGYARFRANGRMPRSIELNVFAPSECRGV